MEKILKDHNLKVTPGRIKILQFLSKDNKPQTAEDIYKSLKKQFDLATIYRNLEKFEDQDILFKESVNKKDYYYLAKSAHHHIVCRKCDKMECVPCTSHKFSIKNFTNIKHQLLLTGLCRNCSKS